MKENYVVTQGNNLIEARHKKPLSVREQKIILTMVSMINPTDEDFREYVISIKDFHEMLGLQGREKYTEIKTVVENLMSKVIEIPRENGGWLLTHWVSSAEYIQGKGSIRLKFVPELKPYMLQLKSQFTSYRLSNVLSLNSTYSIRLYELMKKWHHLGKWECSIEDLRGKLGVVEKIYPRYANFKIRVLKAAIDEVNEKTDLLIDFQEIKKGRSVERIEFTIKHSVEKEIKLPIAPEKPKKNDVNEDIRERLNLITQGYNFDQPFFTQMYQGASLIWNDAAENELQMLIRYVNEEETVKNPLGFIKSKIKTAWDIHQDGFPITFADLKVSKRTTGRTEVIPDWFNERNTSKEETVATVVTEEYQEKKRALLESLGKSPEEIEEEMNG
ncbi:replication initiation protein [Paenisporosarcina sp. OV554]|uniref:replication initiation protein n=1 Tax=Paenisporosarcina sp. OV554 TaxID=2135694 RepID=UPI000D4A0CF4|nr:replication initiation protein [Paenisporosarcina sp. OV554]PUB08161.1 replication initiator protein [Paenisporosarcina sp. OV554]